MTMSEHQKHTEFLRQCILYEDSAGRHELEKGIVQIQRDARCVWRAAWLMAILIAFVVAGLGYGEVLADNFLYDTQPFLINLICALGVGSIICLVVLVGLGLIYRMKLDQRREECRQLVAKLLESRLGKPVAPVGGSGRDNRVGEAEGRNFRDASEVKDPALVIEAAAQA
jgi:hypothetical protein